MNPPPNPLSPISLSDHPLFILLMKRRRQVLIAVLLGLGLSIASYFMLPRKYKVTTSISLQSQYFSLPLVSGFMPENHDPAELRAKREALINLALSQKFILQVTRRYELVKDVKKILPNSQEMAEVRKRFEMVPMGASGFQVSFVGKDPIQSYQVLQDFLAQLQMVMINERHTLLFNLHDAIQEQLEAMSLGKMGEGSNAILASRPDLLSRRIEKIQSEIEALKSTFSERHPRIASLKEQLAHLSSIARPLREETQAPAMTRGDLFAGIRVDDNQKELFDDLMKKYRYLEVVIYMDQQNKEHYLSFLSEPFIPDAPIFPKLPLLLAWGLVGGFLAGAARVLLKERRATAQPKPSVMAVSELTPRRLAPSPIQEKQV